MAMFSRKDSPPPGYLSVWTPDHNHFIPVMVLQSLFF
jgi:hypothetical protein